MDEIGIVRSQVVSNSNEKILFLGHPQVSHALDTLFDGCINVFGAQNVFDYPILKKYHSSYQDGSSYAWWCQNNTQNVNQFTLQDYAQMINTRQIRYILGTNRAIENFKKLLAMIKQDVYKDLCVVFFEEECYEVHRICLDKLKYVYDKIDIHYKVDLIQNPMVDCGKIRPAYIGGPIQKLYAEIGAVKNFEQRRYDICYIVGASHTNRKMYYDLLVANFLSDINTIVYGEHRFSLNEYFNRINDSKIVISVRGAEYSNTRNIEGPLLGAALFTEISPIVMPFDYENEKSAIFFNADNLIIKLRELLKKPDKLKNLANASYEWAGRYHTTTARANQMITLAKQIKGW